MPHNVESSPLRLSSQTLPEIRERNVQVYDYDRASLKHGIVHVGVGGFHRAHLAFYIDRILSQLKADNWAICGVGLTPWDSAMRDALVPQDTLYTLLERGAAGTTARVIGSITDYIFAPGNSEQVIAKMAHADTHIVSMTITESGYFYNENTHELMKDHPDIKADLAADEANPKTIFGYLFEAQSRRRAAGLKPFTVLSCDNMQKNGSITRSMLLSFARLKDPAVADWLAEHGAFPNSMVDRITPRTSDSDKALLATDFGVEDAWPVVTEPFTQWVLEDRFSDGRPPLDKVGVQVVQSVHDVEQFEMHKLRLLNGSHSAIAYLGFLAGFKYVDEVLADPLWHRYVSTMMHTEVKPLLPAIPGVDLDQYCETLMERFSNPTLKDEIARLCIGGSGKLPQFIMPSIAEQIMRASAQTAAGKPVDAPLRCLTLAVAGWFRYLSGVDEQGKNYTIKSIDEPIIDDLQPLAREGGRAPTKLIGIRHLFGDDLRGDERFMRKLTDALASLYDRGAKVTLADTV
jgi:mannitol 2-dehydrogenase